MKYLLLAYGDGQNWVTLSRSERERYEQACQTGVEILRDDGYILVSERLQEGIPAIIFCVEKGKLVFIDELNAYAQKQLTNLFIIKASDLNEAIQVASKLPQAQHGPIEVRPIA